MAFAFMKKISPEYVLENAIKDIKAAGIDGLKPYLTAQALNKIEKVQTVSDEINMFSAFVTGNYSMTKMLITKMADCDYTIVDVLKGSESAKGVVRFKYEDSMDGTVELTMIKEDKEWKIDKFEMPSFDKIDMTITAGV